MRDRVTEELSRQKSVYKDDSNITSKIVIACIAKPLLCFWRM